MSVERNGTGKIEEEIAILIHRAEQMGFRFVDLYIQGDELIAFTCSRTKEYVDALQTIE